MEKKLTTIGNLHCVFDWKSNKKPLLAHFIDIFYPAISAEKYIRVTKKSNVSFYISDVKLIDLWNGELALVGKHYKRTTLVIKQDYTYEKGIEKKGKIEVSAPFSTFIILLRNHRVINIADQQGSPDLRSLATTIREILKQHRKTLYDNILNEMKENKFVYDGKQFKSVKEFKEYFNKKVPIAYVSLISMIDDEMVDKFTSELKKINFIKYRLENTNCELDLDPVFDDLRELMKQSQADSIETKVNNPEVNERFRKSIKSTKGLIKFSLKGKNIDNETVKLSEDSFSQKREIDIDPKHTTEQMAQNVYFRLKDRDEIAKNTSTENLKIYEKWYNRFKNLL